MAARKSSKKLIFLMLAIVGSLILFNLLVALHGTKLVRLSVNNNKGASWLTTVDSLLVAVFRDGQVCVWDWNDYSQKQDFSVYTDRVVVQDEDQLIAINQTGRKILGVYDLLGGNLINEVTVGQQDQDVWPRISPDRKVLMLVRKDVRPIDSEFLDYEFLLVDVQKELFHVPVSLSIRDESETLIDYFISDEKMVYIVGSRNEAGRILAIDLNEGKVLWDVTYPDTREFCSLTGAAELKCFYAGNRDGFLYKIDTGGGQILKKIRLLKEGETRVVTNDVSVLNLSLSPHGKYLAATITPIAYLLDTETDTLFFRGPLGHKLLSKIAFSPDESRFASSDIRASGTINIRNLEEQ